MPLLLFESTHKILKAEQALRNCHIPCDVIPTPKNISSECGMSLNVPIEAKDKAISILQEKKIVYKIYV